MVPQIVGNDPGPNLIEPDDGLDVAALTPCHDDACETGDGEDVEETGGGSE